jgi:putative spermidine/putrescine transport system permease protein
MTDLAVGPAAAAPSTRPPISLRARAFGARWAPALPLLALVAVCLVLPLVVVVAQTFWVNDSLSLDLWARVLGQRVNQDAILTSLALGVSSATVTLIIGSPIAWLISRMVTSGRAFWLGLLNVAANFGGIGLAFAYLATLGAVGMITLILQALGLPFVPPRSSSFLALLMAYEYTNVPLFVLLTIPAMGVLRDDWWEAAQTASATRWQFWRMVGLPVLSPFLAAGFLLIFTWSIGIYGIAYGLAGQSGGTAARLITLQIGSVLSSDVLTGTSQAAVLSVVLLAIAGLSLLGYRRLMRRALRWL